ncbi:MAG: hypothetical protein Q7N87_03020 [Candidatus Uhrbacteria bacterium]|nr:hypothetical protein [Candidatus Uhrbacteria bacterium]
MKSHIHKDAWVVSVNLGYGHERAAFGLKDLAYGKIITANDYLGIPKSEKNLWLRTQKLYETVSRLQPIPFIGQAIFNLMDHFQEIDPFYPRRDLSQPNLQLKEIYHLIEHKGLGKHLIEVASKKNIPFISTFFAPAFAAEVYGYPGDIYIVLCDADISRTWAPRDPKKSRIKYFAPNGRVVERLKLYGVPEDHIFLTGFPLPKQNIGGPEANIVKRDLAARICNLDPQGIFIKKYQETLQHQLGPSLCHFRSTHPLTLTFSVGGAGAQKQLGLILLTSLRNSLLQKKIRLNLEVGTKKIIGDFFLAGAKKLGLKSLLGSSLHIHQYPDRATYFQNFTRTLRTTDILWTKPSELSFYAGLGLPIIMAPPIGSQEDFNKVWLKTVNGGLSQNDPRYTNEWLFDWINSGGLARFAWNGYIEAPTHGAYRIESIITGEKTPLAELPLIV